MKHLRLLAYLVVAFSCVGFTACNEKTTEATSTLISSFYLLSPDSTEAIEKAYFYVNADTTFTYNGVAYEGYIQNRDSMAYGTDVSKVVPVVTSLSIISTILNDSITYSSEDTIDFTSPMKVLVYAQDITISQLYLAKANVHQIDEQLYLWDEREYPEFSYLTAEQPLFYGGELLLYAVSGGVTKLQRSADKAKTWLDEAVTVASLPAACVGQVVVGKKNLYAADGSNFYVSEDGEDWTSKSITGSVVKQMLFSISGAVFALTEENEIVETKDDGENWTKVMDCASSFPYEGFDVVEERTPSGRMQYALVGGTSKTGEEGGVWATEDGCYWVNMSREGKKMVSRTNAAAVAYDHKLLIIGGTENGEVADSIAMSPDFGLSWGNANAKVYPSPYIPTTKSHALVDDEYRLFLIGGKNMNGNFTKTILSGRKNETYFKEYE